MRKSIADLALAASAFSCGTAIFIVLYQSLAISTPVPDGIITSHSPCLAVGNFWTMQQAATPTPTVDARLALECLRSVPLQKSAAVKFIDELKPYMEWQSDLAFMKRPPPSFDFPAIDVFDTLERIKDDLLADHYQDEHSWQQDLFLRVFGRAHNGHLYLLQDVLTNAVEWERPFTLVTVVDEQQNISMLKTYDDMLAIPGQTSYISHINGVSAEKFLLHLAMETSASCNLDSAYNALMYSRATAASDSSGQFRHGGRGKYVFPGEATILAFGNGTSTRMPNVARLKGNWTGVTDGLSFLRKFAPHAYDLHPSTINGSFSGNTTGTFFRSDVRTAEASKPTAIKGYPKPVMISSNLRVSGYFLQKAGYEDVAVLCLRAFGSEDPGEFQMIIQDFFAAAMREKKTKLVVDLQTNGGGYVLQGYDTFRQLFPDISPRSAGRWRLSPGLRTISKVALEVCKDYDGKTASETMIQHCESVYDWRHDLNMNSEHFESYDAKFSPIRYNDDSFTDLLRPDLNNELETTNSTYGFGHNLTGHGSRDNFTRPFGAADNVILLLDGQCGSTCALFAHAMKYDAGVQSVAMGGRIENKGRTQGIGGVKGSLQYTFERIHKDARWALRSTKDGNLRSRLSNFTSYVIERTSHTGVNVRDEILGQNLEDGTPAQFVTELADCRLFWREKMHRSMTDLWTAVADVAFKEKQCDVGFVRRF